MMTDKTSRWVAIKRVLPLSLLAFAKMRAFAVVGVLLAMATSIQNGRMARLIEARHHRHSALSSHTAATHEPQLGSATVSVALRAKLRQYAPLIKAAAFQHGIPAALVAAVIRQESNFNPQARSHRGAGGLMQLMPATAASVGVDDVGDPAQNINGGTRYLKHLLDRFDGNIDKALAAYNSGPTRVVRYGGVPPFAETQRYVHTVKQFALNFKDEQLLEHD